MYFLLKAFLVFLAVATLVRTDTDCPPDPEQVFPNSSLIYGVVGQNVTIVAYHNASYPTIILFNDTVSPSADISCSGPGSVCTLDQNTGSLTIRNFQPTYAGQYSLLFRQSIFIFCSFRFNLTQAIPPSITASNSQLTIDADSGPLVLSLTVNTLGTPPGEVQWFKSGMSIATGDRYLTSGAVQASDRGLYIANISNLAGSSQFNFTVFVNFRPMITITDTMEGSGIRVRCDAISYPAATSIQLLERNSQGAFVPVINAQGSRDGTLRQDTYDYEANVTYLSTECPKVFRCEATAGGITGFALHDICQTTPNVTNLMVVAVNSTNTSAFLTWSLQPPTVSVTEYYFEYRVSGTSQWMRYTGGGCSTSRTFCAIQGLSPGMLYQFQIRAKNTIDTGPYTNIITFQAFSAPQSIPIGLSVKRNESSDGSGKQLVLEWQPVPSFSYSPVTFYQVSYNTGSGTPVTVINTTNLYFILKRAEDRLSYFLKVRALNQWGMSAYSAVVEATSEDKIDPNGRVTVQLAVSISNTFVVLRWNISNSQEVANVMIIINELEITSSGLQAVVTSTRVFTHVTTPFSRHQCFSDLNRSDRYQFCIIATLRNGANKTNCTITSTSTSHRTLEDANDCQSIAMQTGNNSLIPTWLIAVIVVGSVLLVFVIFGGCGLYYGIKRNQKGGADFDSPQPSVEDVNGYPYPSKRAPSPSRSCMAYRHNQQHQHGIDWRVTNPQDITEV